MRRWLVLLVSLGLVLAYATSAPAAPGPDPDVESFDLFISELRTVNNPDPREYDRTHFEVGHPTGWDWGLRHAYACAYVEHFTNNNLDFEVHYELFQGYPIPVQINDTAFVPGGEPVNGSLGPCGDGVGPGASLTYTEAEYGDHHPHSDVENTGDLVFYRDTDGDGFNGDNEIARIDYDDPDNCDEGY